MFQKGLFEFMSAYIHGKKSYLYSTIRQLDGKLDGLSRLRVLNSNTGIHASSETSAVSR